MKIFINHKFTTLNEYIKAERTNRYLAANIKREETLAAFYSTRNYAKEIQKSDKPLKIIFRWHLKDRRIDLDNASFAKKFILDGLVLAKAIKNDGQGQIRAFEDCVINSKNEGVEIEIIQNR